MQIPILSGIFTNGTPDFRTSYPHNYVPVPKVQGISSGYLRPAEGLVEFSAGVGADRGGIKWNNTMYRVQGSSLVTVDSSGVITVIGDIGDDGKRVKFDYSFDYLGVSSNEDLFLYDGTTLSQITDTDLGAVVDFVWIDGYFLTTDGEFLVVTELNDPFSVNPLKYGSSEIDPDPVHSVLELRNEVYAVNENSIEVFDNIGGSNFPFQRISGAQIQKGSVGTHAAVVFNSGIAFVGGGRDDPPAVHIAAGGQDIKISSREIELVLASYTSTEIASTVLEARNDAGHQFLYVHLPDQTLVFDAAASAVMDQLVWFTLSGGTIRKSKYPAAGFVWCYDKWLSGDPVSGKIAELRHDVSRHFGEKVGWIFNTTILFNEGRGAIVHNIELNCLTGATELGKDPVVTTEYSLDGQTWSQPRTVKAGKQGDRAQRIAWRRNGKMRNWRIQRFSGTSDAHVAISRLDVVVEGLAI